MSTPVTFGTASCVQAATWFWGLHNSSRNTIPSSHERICWGPSAKLSSCKLTVAKLPAKGNVVYALADTADKHDPDGSNVDTLESRR